jgi:hypothetical protein
MAKLYPAGMHGINDWERKVLANLKDQLGDEFIVYSNVFMAGNRLRAGFNAKQHVVVQESDCVIVSPRHGVLLLEVKGPSLERQDDGNWAYRHGGSISPADDPIMQAAQNLNTLKEHLIRAMGQSCKKIPFPYGFAIAFPGHNFPLNRRPQWYSSSYIYLADDIPFLGDRVRRSLKDWNQFQKANQMPPELIREITAILREVQVDTSASEFPQISQFVRPMFETAPKVVEREDRDIRGTDLKFEDLTRDQAEVVFAAEENPRLLVRGMAGSGKTVIALDHACRLAEHGHKVIVLCFNAALGEHLAKRVEKYPHVRAGSFYEFVNETLGQAGLKPISEKEEGYWESLPAERLEQALNLLKGQGKPLEFDALVVDEGQDFQPEWWMVLEELIRETDCDGAKAKRVAVFYDPLQNLFGRPAKGNGDPALPDQVLENCTRLTLRHNCRNTLRIARYIEMATDRMFPCKPGVPDGKAPGFHDMRNDWQSASRALENLVTQLIDDGFELRDIAIARWHSTGKALEIPKIKTTDNIHKWAKGDAILYTTVRRFKGLEANALILFDIPEPGTEKSYSKSDHYVAISRARQELALFVRQGFRKPEKPIEPADYGPMEA